ncbi:RNA polymerase sigma factor [Fodinicola feengrottensis]|uniref:RNA polymerase sigma factor n=1 Tax=Fodinicola feengrottensis TaxID=435914 RepID=A0ABN2IPX0_9ACTN|nr:RNA polymerase sigma factor [Fodinicola feengrottensis]
MRADETAVRELYEAEYGRLAGWSNKLVNDTELAHDITTECFVRLMARWTKVTQPRPWLYMTATNLIRDHWRRQQRERKALVRLAEAPQNVPAPDPTLRDLVEKLPDRMKTVVLLHYYADLPVHEIATVLGKADGTVKRALFDARQKLSEALKADETPHSQEHSR